MGSKRYLSRPRRISESFASLEPRPDSLGESGMHPRDPYRPWRGTLASSWLSSYILQIQEHTEGFYGINMILESPSDNQLK